MLKLSMFLARDEAYPRLRAKALSRTSSSLPAANAIGFGRLQRVP